MVLSGCVCLMIHNKGETGTKLLWASKLQAYHVLTNFFNLSGYNYQLVILCTEKRPEIKANKPNNYISSMFSYLSGTLKCYLLYGHEFFVSSLHVDVDTPGFLLICPK